MGRNPKTVQAEKSCKISIKLKDIKEGFKNPKSKILWKDERKAGSKEKVNKKKDILGITGNLNENITLDNIN